LLTLDTLRYEVALAATADEACANLFVTAVREKKSAQSKRRAAANRPENMYWYPLAIGNQDLSEEGPTFGPHAVGEGDADGEDAILRDARISTDSLELSAQARAAWSASNATLPTVQQLHLLVNGVASPLRIAGDAVYQSNRVLSQAKAWLLQVQKSGLAQGKATVAFIRSLI